ncbi:MAG: RecX family transcriptional regulator, partial [Cytophagales bacterium]
ITTGLKEIDEFDYRNTLISLLKKKTQQITDKDTFQLKDRLARYAIAKGYERDLVWEALKSND